jgi:hypothetical protein
MATATLTYLSSFPWMWTGWRVLSEWWTLTPSPASKRGWLCPPVWQVVCRSYRAELRWAFGCSLKLQDGNGIYLWAWFGWLYIVTELLLTWQLLLPYQFLVLTIKIFWTRQVHDSFNLCMLLTGCIIDVVELWCRFAFIGFLNLMQVIMYLILAVCLCGEEEMMVAYSSVLLHLIAFHVKKSPYIFFEIWTIKFV